jgi:hypothetical protein
MITCTHTARSWSCSPRCKTTVHVSIAMLICNRQQLWYPPPSWSTTTILQPTKCHRSTLARWPNTRQWHHKTLTWCLHASNHRNNQHFQHTRDSRNCWHTSHSTTQMLQLAIMATIQVQKCLIITTIRVCSVSHKPYPATPMQSECCGHMSLSCVAHGKAD